MNAARLKLSTCLGFGVGTVGVSIMLNAVTAYFPAFMTTVLGQSPEIAGFLLMLSKLYDAVADVIIGALSDRTRSRWGRRRPYLLAGAVVSALSFLMLFSPPALSQSALLLYMFAALVLYSTGYSLFNVPYMAMPSEMTDGYQERTRLLSYRTLFVSLGQLLAIAGTSALITHGGGGAAGYRVMGFVTALIVLSAMFASFLGTSGARFVAVKSAHTPFSAAEVLGLLANRPFVVLVLAKIFQFLAFASVATTGLLFMLNVIYIGYDGQIQLAVSINIALALAMPLWVKVGATIGKRNTYLIGVVLYCVAALSWLLTDATITRTDVWLRGLVGGVGSGAIILMSISMLADTMAYDRQVTGQRREGLMSSVIAVIEKTAFALGVAVIGVFLRAMGYLPTTGGTIIAQPAAALRALYICFAVIPSVMFAATALCLMFYDLDESKMRVPPLATQGAG